MNDVELNAIAENEISTNTQEPSLWNKALALMGNNETKAKEKYIKLRILQLKRDGYEPKKSPISQDSSPPKKSTDKPKEKSESPQDSSFTDKSEHEESNKYQLWNKENIPNKWFVWFFSGLICLIIIFIVLVSIGSKEKEDTSNTSYSKELDGLSIDTSVKIDEFVNDSNMMYKFEQKLKKEKEIKEREALEAKEKADIEYLEAIQEMGEEE